MRSGESPLRLSKLDGRGIKLSSSLRGGGDTGWYSNVLTGDETGESYRYTAVSSGMVTGLTGVGATGVGQRLEESGGDLDSVATCELGRLLGETGGDGRLCLKKGFLEYCPNN